MSTTPRIVLALFFGLAVFSAPAMEQECLDNVRAGTELDEFTVVEDGTIIHEASQLMWARCELGQEWNGDLCTGERRVVSIDEALRQAAEHTFADYEDWRVPNIKELESLADIGCHHPAMSLDLFPGAPSDTVLWSSTPQLGSDQGSFWVLDTIDGTIGAVEADREQAHRSVADRLGVRLVRDLRPSDPPSVP